MKTVIISDVHGCYNELIELLDKVKFDKTVDTFVFGGDAMDRGPDSYKVFKFLQGLKEEMGERMHYIMGNHCDFLIKSQLDPYTFGVWAIHNGGNDTCQDFEDHGERVYDYVDWLKENTELYYETKSFIMCHGGCTGNINDSCYNDIVWDRSCVELGNYGGKLLIVGHTPTQCPIYCGILNDKKQSCRLEYAEKKEYEFAQFPTGCIDIDTGCVFGYWLTAMVIEDGKFRLHRVKKHKLVPDTNGDDIEEYSFE